jgi:hypothetical protein
MSAFVVDDTTINKVVSFLASKAMYHRHYWPMRAIEGHYDLTNDEDAHRLAHDMFELNVAAVDARYGEGEAAEFRPLNFEYRSVMPPPAIVVYKALGCWRYQCSEGNVPERQLYQMMESVYNGLAHEIAHDVPAYEAAPWG